MTIVVPGGGQSETLFPDKATAVADLRAGALLLAARRVLPGIVLSDDYIYNKLLVAEKETSRILRVYFVPTIIVPDDAAQAELDALDAAGNAWAQEAAYDYDPDMWTPDRWGFIRTKWSPIISVQSIRLVYPSPTLTMFEIPHDWMRFDKKFGHIRMVPASAAFNAPLNAFLMQAMTGGRNVPFMVQVRYVTGLTDALKEWPDLVDVIKRKAMLKIVLDTFLPQSGSISADGLSQSMSMDLTKYGDAIDETLNGPKGSNGGLMSAIHGVRFGVM